MAVKMLFYPTKDGRNVVQEVKAPTIVLAKKNGQKLGAIPSENLSFDCNLNSSNVIDFKVHKTYNGKELGLWDDITNFKLIWCKEWDAWFEISLDITQSNEITKSITGTSIGEAELSAIKLFNLEVNTESDIERDDYKPTVLYNSDDKSVSLLDKLIEKAPHYTIKHVDETIAPLQRTFEFDDDSILDSFNDISEEIGCLFFLTQRSDESGRPERGIYVYDLESHCRDCGYRGEFTKTCPECGSTRIDHGYGEYTNVFISDENLAKELTLSTSTDEVNIAFKLEAGDDLMTAVVASCNPNGSDYIWYIPDAIRAEMSDSLRTKLAQYDSAYNTYISDFPINLKGSLVSDYNELVDKYGVYKTDLEKIISPHGFGSLIDISYNAIDFKLYLTNQFMPTPQMSDTTASEQAALLTTRSLSPLAVANMSSISKTTVELNVLSFAKAIVRPTYEVKMRDSAYDSVSKTWTGTFIVTNYSDEEDSAMTNSINVVVTDDYYSYIKQKAERLIQREDTKDLSVSELFKKQLNVSGGSYSGEFLREIEKYGLNQLKSFHDCCQACIDILIEEGVSDKDISFDTTRDIYNDIYKDYFNKLKVLEAEIGLREAEIATIDAISENVDSIREKIQSDLNLKDYLGDEDWMELCTFRRESTYSNSNYISDGLSNSELIKNASLFLREARKELIKSATLQHSISSSLNNLLVIPEFAEIRYHFDVGNWIIVKIDGKVYRLRLVNYSIDFDNPSDLSVEFSDVVDMGNDITDIKSVLDKASSMASSYSGIERQVGKNDETSRIVDSWFEKGLDATLTRIVNTADNQTMSFDRHGMLLRKYDDVTEGYFSEQLKIINSTIAITDDDWETTKTAIGKFHYIHPETGELKTAFGVNGETVIGKLIIGESLALYNNDNTMKFDALGLSVTNGVNTFIVNPKSEILMSLTKEDEDLLVVDDEGNLIVTGNINAKTLSTGSKTSADALENGLFIDSDGNLYAGENNETVISANGNVKFGGDKIVYDGSTLAVKGAITATTLATGAKVSSATGNEGIYIDSSGNLYAGSNNETKIYADGKVNLGNGKLVYDGSALTVNGAIVATSLSAGGKTYASHNHDGIYIASTGNLIAGADNTTIIYANGTFNFGNGKLLYNGTNLTVNGAVVATSLSAGGKTSSSDGNNGLYIGSTGNLVAGANSETIIYADGRLNLGNGKLTYNGTDLKVNNVIAKSFKALGTDESISCTLGDELKFINDSSGTDSRLARFSDLYGTVSGTKIYDSFEIYGNSIKFTQTNNGNWVLSYIGQGSAQVQGHLYIDRTLTVGGQVSFGGNILIGQNNNGEGYIIGGSEGTAFIGLHTSSTSSSDDLKNKVLAIFGASAEETSNVDVTVLRGETVRIFSYAKGAVYLGASGSEAITSDENLKDIFEIDDKYSTFFDKLNPVAYKYKVGHRTHLGFGARAVENAIYTAGLSTEDFAGLLIDKDVDLGAGEIISPDGATHFDELYSLRYEEFIALNTMMIKKLQREIKELKEELGK